MGGYEEGLLSGVKMNAEARMILQGLTLQFGNLVAELQRERIENRRKERLEDVPEWVSIKQAVSLKGGGALNTYKQKTFLQPCCGRNWKLVGGRHCWSREDVLEWLKITDETLPQYAKKWQVTLPDTYAKRGE